MLADQVGTIGLYTTALLGPCLLLVLVLHPYAWWTIRRLDQHEDA
jgi:hypothetical protein